MMVKESSNWRTIVILAGGASLLIAGIVWSKKKLSSHSSQRSQEEKKKNKKAEPSMDVSNNEEIVEVNTSIPELPEPKWVKVGYVEELHFYPLKSGRGKKLEKCTFTGLGICAEADIDFSLKDRMFLVYNEETGIFQSARQFPTLLLVGLSAANDNCVKLEAVGMPNLLFKVPINPERNCEIIECTMWIGEKVECIDCGNDAAKWISSFLTGTNSGLRLGSPCKLKNCILKRTSMKEHMEIHNSIESEDTEIFSDLASYMLMSKESLNDLNKRLECPVSALQFRPNIIVSGIEAFSEDTWEWIKIGERAIIRNMKPCKRFREFKGLKMGALEKNIPSLGIYCILYVTGPVKIGDQVFIHKPADHSQK